MPGMRFHFESDPLYFLSRGELSLERGLPPEPQDTTCFQLHTIAQIERDLFAPARDQMKIFALLIRRF